MFLTLVLSSVPHKVCFGNLVLENIGQTYTVWKKIAWYFPGNSFATNLLEIDVKEQSKISIYI